MRTYILYKSDIKTSKEIIIFKGIYNKEILKFFKEWQKGKGILNNMDIFDDGDIKEYITCDKEGNGYTLQIRKGK